MNCEKCGANVDEPFVLKRGSYADQPLCEKCFFSERKKLLGE